MVEFVTRQGNKIHISGDNVVWVTSDYYEKSHTICLMRNGSELALEGDVLDIAQRLALDVTPTMSLVPLINLTQAGAPIWVNASHICWAKRDSLYSRTQLAMATGTILHVDQSVTEIAAKIGSAKLWPEFPTTPKSE